MLDNYYKDGNVILTNLKLLILKHPNNSLKLHINFKEGRSPISGIAKTIPKFLMKLSNETHFRQFYYM